MTASFDQAQIGLMNREQDALRRAEFRMQSEISQVQQVAGNTMGGYTSECNQPMTNQQGYSITYYFPCSPVPQNAADQ